MSQWGFISDILFIPTNLSLKLRKFWLQARGIWAKHHDLSPMAHGMAVLSMESQLAQLDTNTSLRDKELCNVIMEHINSVPDPKSPLENCRVKIKTSNFFI